MMMPTSFQRGKGCLTVIFVAVALISVAYLFSAQMSAQDYFTFPAMLQRLENQTHLLIKQRNEISRLLNGKMQEIAILNCEKANQTSSSGAFCGGGLHGHLTDKPLAAKLQTFFKGKRVGSFGDGLGEYKKLMANSNEGPSVYDAYDGTPNVNKLSEGRVSFLDLAIPQYGLPHYDLVMSLEVAEHIPAQFEQTFLDNIVRYADEGVILSWAVIGQGGYHHVNNRPLEYVIQQFKDRGFEMDKAASSSLQEAATLDWLKKNTYVYRRTKQRV